MVRFSVLELQNSDILRTCGANRGGLTANPPADRPDTRGPPVAHTITKVYAVSTTPLQQLHKYLVSTTLPCHGDAQVQREGMNTSL